ncbi:TonB-dependent receptor [Maribellus sp. CM-23]|nr:TonB-dependent receptor [Maribellus sp. CM-23]
MKNIRIEKFLEEYIVPIGYEYEIINQTVVIKKAPEQVSEKAQKPKGKTVTGKVSDESGAFLPGVTITVLGSTKGVITDADGEFEINGIEPTDKLVFSFIGMESQVVDVGNETLFEITMKEKIDELDEVTIVAFGKQKKESVISSITTVDVDNLKSIPTSNITTALSGQMTGLISYQSTGAPGDDNAQFFIRNAASFGNNVQSPLILIDNVEVDVRSLSRLSPDDIQSFSILKDAAATALYGARGGNGVVLITTKEGKEGEAVIDIRAETSLSMPTTRVDIADPISYMQYFNEAILTRNPTASPRYSLDKIEKTQNPNRNPYVYPATNWLDELTKDYAINTRMNMSINGGGKVASYYVAGSYSQDNGILNVDNINKWNTNIDFKKYTLRSNVNINVTEKTKLNVRLSGSFDDYQGPIGELGNNGRNTYYQALNADPVLFPAVYKADKEFAYAPYLLFGNYDNGQYINPYARLMSGYEDNKASTLSAQLELHQDLDFITKGLQLRFIGNVSRFGSFSLRRSYNPYYFTILPGDYDPYEDSLTPEPDGYILYPINPETGSRFIEYDGGDQDVNSSLYSELSVIYNSTFNEKHDVGGLLVGTVRDYLEGSPIYMGLENSLPKRNLSLAGRFTYAYKGKYFTEFNFGYNGSERFASGDRFGFFPSFGAGWDVSKEDFYTNLGIQHILSKLKVRGTYGLVGNDNLGGPNRFYYLSSVSLNGGHAGFWGNDVKMDLYSKPTVYIRNPGNPEITWEITNKANLALEMGFFENKLSIVPEIYRERRKNILQRRSNIPATLGLPYELYSNVQENLATGVEVAIDYNDRIGEDIWFLLRGNFTYGTAEVVTYDEIGTDKAPWISRIGHSPSQRFGFVAEHLFIDEYEVANSASQAALGGEIMAGDIKYVDINKDGVINQFDVVPIGYPQVPEIQYGFGGSFGYKKIDFSMFFQGQAHYSFWLNPYEMAPFMPTGGGNRALLGWIAENHWSESNRDLYAQWPRLSNVYSVGNQNNFQSSTYFMKTTSYLRLKQLEIGYTLPKAKSMEIRAYLSGTNLLTFSKFKLWDPEMGGNGLAYPLQKVFNVGVQINFR